MYFNRFFCLCVLQALVFLAKIDAFSYLHVKNSRSFKSFSMKAEIRAGSVVALVTPMKPNNSIDYTKLTELLKWHVSEGTAGAVILGTTGEASTLSLEERGEVIKTAIAAVKDAFPVIVGVGGIKTSDSTTYAKQAEEFGADGILAITPYYVKPPQRALVAHFKEVSQSTSLPIILYNCPGRTGVGITPETVAICAEFQNVIGLKDAVGDVVQRSTIIKDMINKPFLIFSGEDDLGCELALNGGDGVISVTANVAPGIMQKMLTAAMDKNETTALALNDKLVELHSGLFCESNPIPVKRALELMGKIESGIRPPLCRMDDIHLDRIKSALKRAEVFKKIIPKTKKSSNTVFRSFLDMFDFKQNKN